tara:strand:+ start:239 stop:1003 length:765 start_codon:yes stop_codon:yes gene_type:complete
MYFIKIKKFLKKILISESKESYRQVFASLKDAKKFSSQLSDYVIEVNDLKRASKYLENINFSDVDRNIILPILLSIINKKDYTILDVGGGNPPIYESIKKITKADVKSFILETDKFVEEINNKIPNSKSNFIKYITSLDEIKIQNINIVYFGSSLQYIKKYKDFLYEIFTIKPEYIVITDTVFTKKNYDFYVLQNNMEDSLFPCLFFSEISFLDYMYNHGYDCIFNFDNPSINKHKTLNQDQYDFKHLIFRKIY